MSLVRADSIALPFADDSVDLIVTSPPYFALRSYTDGGEHYDRQIGSEPTPRDFLAALWAVTAECKRVMKPTGSMFVNLGDKYAGSGGHNNSSLAPPRTGDFATRKHNGEAPRLRASRRSAPDRYNQTTDVPRKSLMGLPWLYAHGCTGALAALGGPDPGLDLTLRAEIVWSKRNGLPESVTDRVRRSHEQWFHLTKSPDYFADMDDIREPYNPAAHNSPPGSPIWGDDSYPTWGLNGSQSIPKTVGTRTPPDPRGKLPNSVWEMSSEPLQVPEHLNIDHFAAFPQEWPRRFTLGWSPADGIVLDPFGGTGTTAMVANALGRYGVSVDLSADYLRLARWRIYESGHGRKAIARTWSDRQGSLSIFSDSRRDSGTSDAGAETLPTSTIPDGGAAHTPPGTPTGEDVARPPASSAAVSHCDTCNDAGIIDTSHSGDWSDSEDCPDCAANAPTNEQATAPADTGPVA